MDIKIQNYKLNLVGQDNLDNNRYFLLSKVLQPTKKTLKNLILKNLKRAYSKNMLAWEILDRQEKNDKIIVVIKEKKRFGFFLGKNKKQVSNENILRVLEKSVQELKMFLNSAGINIEELEKSYEKVLTYNQNPNLIRTAATSTQKQLMAS